MVVHGASLKAVDVRPKELAVAFDLPSHAPRETEEQSIKARKRELYDAPRDDAVPALKPFPEYLRETPAAPMPAWGKGLLIVLGLIVALLLAAALWRGTKPRQASVRPAARSGSGIDKK